MMRTVSITNTCVVIARWWSGAERCWSRSW